MAINDIIQGLQKINDEKIKKFKLPVSGIKVSLKPFQAKHNTMVSSSFAAGNDGTYTIKFSTLLLKIFNDLLEIEGAHTYSDIPLVDAHYIALKIRKSFSDDLVVKPMEDGKDAERVNINPYIKRFETYKEPDTIKVGEGTPIVVELKQPTLSKTERYDKILLASHKKYAKQNDEQLVRDAFEYTLLKYIDTVSIKIDNEFKHINLSDITPQERRQIINNIPNKMYKDVMQGVESITDSIGDLLKIDDDNSIAMDHTLLLDI